LALFNILDAVTIFATLGAVGVVNELSISVYVLVFCVPVTFDLKRLKYSIHFKKS